MPAPATSTHDALFTELWLQYGTELHRRCVIWMGGNHADADEAWSRASYSFYRKLPHYLHSVKNPRAWLLRLTYNVCMDLHRENKRRQVESIDASSEVSIESPLPVLLDLDPEQSYLSKELHEFLQSCVDELPERLRLTMLAHLSAASYKEIARDLGINEANVRKRMQEARALLRRRLCEYRAGRQAKFTNAAVASSSL